MRNNTLDKQAKIKILIIRLSSIGDILLSTPFIRQVRKAFPNATIYYVVKKEYQDLLMYNPNLDHLIILDKGGNGSGLKKIKNYLKNEKFNYIFDLHNNFRSIYLRGNLKSDYMNYIRKDKFRQLALVYFKKNWYTQVIPIPERYFSVARDVGLVQDDLGLEIHWNDCITGKLNKKLENHKISIHDDFISIAPGASFFSKRWPVEYFDKIVEKVISELKYKVCVLGDKNDARLGKFLARHKGIFDLTDKLSLLESAMILSKSKALISNDTGLMHMAVAVQTPVLAIFGSTVKELGFFPYKGEHIVVEVNNLSCRPCSHLGKKKCPKKHFRCMLDIKPDMVWENLIKLIATAPQRKKIE
jgi:heptosyltransferase-2